MTEHYHAAIIGTGQAGHPLANRLTQGGVEGCGDRARALRGKADFPAIARRRERSLPTRGCGRAPVRVLGGACWCCR